jgi:hypothetical protein
MLRFNEVQRNALKNVKTLDQVINYGLKGFNLLEIKPDTNYTSTDQNVIFTIDSSKLSGNVMLNSIELFCDYKVTASGTALAAAPTYNASAPLALNTAQSVPYFTSASNGGLDSLVVNKSFSSIQMSDKQVSLIDDTRTPDRIEILSRLFEKENLEQSGIYLEDTYGSFDQKYPGKADLLPLCNPASTLNPPFGAGSEPEDVLYRNKFWKQNTSDMYITTKKSVFFNGTTELTNATLTYPWAQLNRSATSLEYVQTPSAADSQQTTFSVREFLAHDILSTPYQKGGLAMVTPLPSQDLVITFKKSNILDSLYKTSNVNITSIKVEITDIKIQILTFNFGLLSIPVDRPVFMPFFSEVVNQETVTLDATNKTLGVVTQTRQYNSIPSMILVYALEQSSTSGTNSNKTNSLTTAKIDAVSLQVDNDSGTPLYNQKVYNLKKRTLAHLADSEDNVDALFRSLPLACKDLQTEINGLGTSIPLVNAASIKNGVTSGRSYLDGMFLLSCDQDIRLPPNTIAGLDTKISFTWTIDFDKLSNTAQMGTNRNIIFYTVALFPAVYKLSADKGMLTSTKLVISNEMFKQYLEEGNMEVRDNRMTHDYKYATPDTLIVGSGLGQLYERVKKYAPVAKSVVNKLSSAAEEISDLIPHPTAMAVNRVARVIKNLTAGKKVEKRGRKPKITK